MEEWKGNDPKTTEKWRKMNVFLGIWVQKRLFLVGYTIKKSLFRYIFFILMEVNLPQTYKIQKKNKKKSSFCGGPLFSFCSNTKFKKSIYTQKKLEKGPIKHFKV